MKGLRGEVVEESSQNRQTRRHTCCEVRKRTDRSIAQPLLLQESNTPQANGWGVSAGVPLVFRCVCVSVPFVFECVGEVYYMVLDCSFYDVVLQTRLCSTLQCTLIY